MNFDDLFGLLLFVVFIALPALSRLAGRKKPGGGASPNPGAPARGSTPTASTAQPSAPTAGGSATTAAGGDELERRLAEARERVRTALEGPRDSRSTTAPSQTQAPPRTAAPASGPARPTPTPRTGRFMSADRDDGLLSTPLDPNTMGMLGRERQATRARPARIGEAPALQVERPGSLTGARTSRGSSTFATDPESIRMALVWHQVLGEPRVRRPLGGRPSTLRSR